MLSSSPIADSSSGVALTSNTRFCGMSYIFKRVHIIRRSPKPLARTKRSLVAGSWIFSTIALWNGSKIDMIESLQLQMLESLLESRFYIMTKEMVWLCSLFNALNANENDVGAVGTFPRHRSESSFELHGILYQRLLVTQHGETQHRPP